MDVLRDGCLVGVPGSGGRSRGGAVRVPRPELPAALGLAYGSPGGAGGSDDRRVAAREGELRGCPGSGVGVSRLAGPAVGLGLPHQVTKTSTPAHAPGPCPATTPAGRSGRAVRRLGLGGLRRRDRGQYRVGQLGQPGLPRELALGCGDRLRVGGPPAGGGGVHLGLAGGSAGGGPGAATARRRADWARPRAGSRAGADVVLRRRGRARCQRPDGVAGVPHVGDRDRGAEHARRAVGGGLRPAAGAGRAGGARGATARAAGPYVGHDRRVRPVVGDIRPGAEHPDPDGPRCGALPADLEPLAGVCPGPGGRGVDLAGGEHPAGATCPGAAVGRQAGRNLVLAGPGGGRWGGRDSRRIDWTAGARRLGRGRSGRRPGRRDDRVRRPRSQCPAR